MIFFKSNTEASPQPEANTAPEDLSESQIELQQEIARARACLQAAKSRLGQGTSSGYDRITHRFGSHRPPVFHPGEAKTEVFIPVDVNLELCEGEIQRVLESRPVLKDTGVEIVRVPLKNPGSYKVVSVPYGSIKDEEEWDQKWMEDEIESIDNEDSYESSSEQNCTASVVYEKPRPIVEEEPMDTTESNIETKLAPVPALESATISTQTSFESVPDNGNSNEVGAITPNNGLKGTVQPELVNSNESDIQSTSDDEMSKKDKEDQKKISSGEEQDIIRPDNEPPVTADMKDANKEFLKDLLSRPKILRLSGIEITADQLGDIRKPEGKLADSVIDYYLKLIEDRSRRPPGSKSTTWIYAFNSSFYQVLSKSNGVENAKKMTSGVDLFSYGYLYIPALYKDHWRLIVVDIQRSIISSYNSIKKKKDKKIKDNVDRYLREMWNKTDANKTGKKPVKFTCRKVDVEAPQQADDSANDCGVFILTFANYLSRNKELDFGPNHVAYFRERILYECINKNLL